MVHGLDGAVALRALILLRAPNAVAAARFALCGRAVLDCLARAGAPRARAALKRGAPHALAYLGRD